MLCNSYMKKIKQGTKNLKLRLQTSVYQMIMKHYIIASENFSIIPMVVILMVCCISL